MATLLTTAQAAKKLNVTRPRVLALIYEGRIKTQKIGTQHLIEPRELAKLKIGKPGRPRNDSKPSAKG